MKNTLTYFFVCLSMSLFAQTYSVTGIVLDKENQPLPGAHISLLHPWGEVFKTTVSKVNGKFIMLELSQGGYVIKISYIGYADFQKEVTISDESVDVGMISLSDGVHLDQVEITGKIPLAEQKGDTTQFNADAFKTLSDASAEDLLKKMPGVVVENGKVQAQGEDVKEVLVDGKPFFGNDPTAAIRNLPAEVISKIQVFDQASEQSNFTGFQDGETTKTINIITRSGMKNGQFGKFYGGYGYEEKYQAGGNASLFDGKRRISIIVQSNNINQQNFSSEDLLGVVGSGGRGRGGRGRGGRGGGRGRRGGGVSANDFLIAQQGGIATTHAFGLNYSDKWGEKMEIASSYFFNLTDNTSEEESSTVYVDSENIVEQYKESVNSTTKNTNHRLNMRLTYRIDSVNSIILRPRLSMQINDGQSNIFGQTLFGTALLNQTDNQYLTDLNGLDFSNSLLYRHRFAKRGRTISVDFRQSYDDKIGESSLYSEDVYFDDFTRSDTLDQAADLDINGWSLSSNVTYTEPLTDNSRLMVTYRASWQEDHSDKQTLDFDKESQSYSLLNPDLSNIFKNKNQSQQVGAGYNFNRGRDFFVMLRANVQWSELTSDQIFPIADQVHRNYVNFVPFGMLRYRFSRQENLRLFYRSSTRMPTVEQLQNVLDNSNPLQLSVGNEALDQAFEHRLSFRYSKTNTEKATVLYLYLNGSYTNNYIANSTYLMATEHPIFEELRLERGAQLSRPVNLDGYWNTRLYATYGMPLKTLKTNLNIDLSASVTRTPGLINDVLNYSNSKNVGLGLTLSSNISEKVDFSISTRSNYNHTKNTLQENLNNTYLNQTSALNFAWIIPKGIVFRTNLSHQLYTGLSDGFDDSYFLWQAGIGKKLFKNQRGEITLSVFDLLNQNQSISRNITETYIEDLKTNVLQRYAMLTFTYNFRNFNTGKAIPEEEERKPRWMR